MPCWVGGAPPVAVISLERPGTMTDVAHNRRVGEPSHSGDAVAPAETEARRNTTKAPTGQRPGPSSVLVASSEDRRFELLRGCPQHAFHLCAWLYGGVRGGTGREQHPAPPSPQGHRVIPRTVFCVLAVRLPTVPPPLRAQAGRLHRHRCDSHMSPQTLPVKRRLKTAAEFGALNLAPFEIFIPKALPNVILPEWVRP